MEFEKIDCIFERDENKKIIPIKDKIILKEKIIRKDKDNKIIETIEEDFMRIQYVPVTRSQYYVLHNDFEKGNTSEKDTDKEIIKNNLVEPKFSDEEIDNMNVSVFRNIVTHIMAKSLGVTKKEYDEPKKQEYDELKKGT